MSKKTRTLMRLAVTLAIIVVLASVPFLGIFVYAKNIKPAYTNTYYAALPLKYDRLKNVTGEKIVVIGGSSVAFGIDTNIVKEELGKECVNFGLYAAFGLKPMLDLSQSSIGKGDIVVIAPELSSQMYSDYKGYDFLLEALEGRKDMAFELGLSYAPGFVDNLFSYAKESKKLNESGGAKVNGVYAKSSFDNSGNMTFVRDSNIMEELYSPDNIPQISPSIVTDSFAEMINDYTKMATKKGATVYFSFCPVNELSVEEISDDEIDEFVDCLKEKLDCKVISSLKGHILEAGYFYDSNFHANDAGIVYNTLLLVNDIKREEGKMTLNKNKIPSPLAGSMAGEVISSGSTDLFEYTITTLGVTITGLTEQGLKADELEVVSNIEDYTVTRIGNKAFAGCSASKIVLPESITSMSTSLFDNANNLTRVEMNAPALAQVGDGLFDGANDDVKLYVPDSLYGMYTTDYFWGRYSERIDIL